MNICFGSEPFIILIKVEDCLSFDFFLLWNFKHHPGMRTRCVPWEEEAKSFFSLGGGGSQYRSPPWKGGSPVVGRLVGWNMRMGTCEPKSLNMFSQILVFETHHVIDLNSTLKEKCLFKSYCRSLFVRDD